MNVHGNLGRIYNGLNKYIARVIVPRLFSPKFDGPIETLGEGEGLWRLPTNFVRSRMICYCVGVGTEASFDVELAKRGAEVWSFDPTPTAIRYVEALDYPRDRMRFLPLGVWKENCTLKFYQPADNVVNFSVGDIHKTGKAVEGECRTLKTIMTELGHAHLDLLKIDIEGAWDTVIDSFLDDVLEIRALCVEFDSPTSAAKVGRYIGKLSLAGFTLADIDRDNYLFLRGSSMRVH